MLEGSSRSEAGGLGFGVAVDEGDLMNWSRGGRGLTGL